MSFVKFRLSMLVVSGEFPLCGSSGSMLIEKFWVTYALISGEFPLCGNSPEELQI
jgi:hypothetical protein